MTKLSLFELGQRAGKEASTIVSGASRKERRKAAKGLHRVNVQAWKKMEEENFTTVGDYVKGFDNPSQEK